MSNKKSQAILKCFIDIKSSVWFTQGQKTKPCFVTRRTFSSFLFPLSSFRFPVSAFLFRLLSFPFPFSPFPFPDFSRKDRRDSAIRVDCRPFSVLTILTGIDLTKSSKCHKTVSFSEHSVNQTLNLRSIKYRTAGHLVF